MKDFIIPVGVLLIGGYYAKSFFGKGSQDTTGDTVSDAEKDTDASKLSFPESWYSSTADILQTEIPKAYRSSSSVKIVVFKLGHLKNKNDWLHLIAKFGKRTELPMYWNEGLVRLLEAKLKGETFSIKSSKTGKIIKADALSVIKTLFKRKGFSF